MPGSPWHQMNEKWGASIPQVFHGAGKRGHLSWHRWLVCKWSLWLRYWKALIGKSVCAGGRSFYFAHTWPLNIIYSLSEKQDSPWNNALRTLLGSTETLKWLLNFLFCIDCTPTCDLGASDWGSPQFLRARWLKSLWSQLIPRAPHHATVLVSIVF